MNSETPSDGIQMLTVARYEMYKFLRGRKIYVMLGLIALMLSINTAVPPLLGIDLPSDPEAFILNYVGQALLLITVAVTLFASDSLVGEFENRTGFLMFPRPLKRGAIFGGKYLASFGVCAALMALYYAVSCLLSLWFTGSVHAGAATSFGMALLYIAGTSGFAFLFSSMLQKGSTSAILVFASLLIIMPMIESVGMVVSVDPWPLLTHAGGAISNVIVGAETTTMGGGGMILTVYYPKADVAAAVMAGWTVACSALALLLFRRREL